RVVDRPDLAGTGDRRRGEGGPCRGRPHRVPHEPSTRGGVAMVFGPRSRGHLVVGLPRDAFRPRLIFLCTVALFGASGWMLWTGFGNKHVDALLFIVAGWVISLCLHEYAHAVFAYRAGDVGVAEKGYLTLNPLKYAHPLLSIVLPLVFI